MAPHSSTLAWKIPWTEEPVAAVRGVPKSRTRLSDFTFAFHFHALEKEMATHSSVLAQRIPGTGEPVGCRLWGPTESDTTEATQQQQHTANKWFDTILNTNKEHPGVLKEFTVPVSLSEQEPNKRLQVTIHGSI